MFVDFNRVFKNKPQTQLSVPPAFIKYINSSLPAGVKYIVDENGDCAITSAKEKFSVGGFVLKPTDEQKKVLGKNFNREDVLNYSYNAQERIPLELIKEGYILLNGHEFPIEKMVYNPLAPIKYVSGSFYMQPPQLPNPFSVKVGCKKYERSLLVSRIPHNSVSTVAFESSKEYPLYVKYFIDNKKQTLTMNISFNLKKAKSIKDIVESTSIYNAFLDGNGTFLGYALKTELRTNNIKEFDRSSIFFWEKVLKIEEMLEVSFVPPNGDVNSDIICLVEQLYQNLINKTPVRDNQTIDFVDVDCKTNEIENEIIKSVGSPICFEFEKTSCVELFGVEKKLPSLVVVFNAILRNYTHKGGKLRLAFADEDKEKKRYTAIMYFKTGEELNAYKTNDYDRIIPLFRDAKKIYEYH